MAAEGAQAVVGLLNKVIKYAVGLGVGASVAQSVLFTGAPTARTRSIVWRWRWLAG
jgi:hypothetical protein